MNKLQNTAKLARSICVAAPLLFGAAAAHGQVITHLENAISDATNDSEGIRIPIPANTTTPTIINGEINRSGDVDLWAFEVNNFSRAIEFQSTASRVIWANDTNRNRRSDIEDSNIILTRGYERHQILLRNGPIILARVTGEPGQKYTLFMNAENKPTRDVNVTFIDGKAIDRFDGRFRGKADFRAKITFTKAENGRSPAASKKISNNNNPTFNLALGRPFSLSTRKVPIELRLVDVDRASKDDVADISPNVPGRSLNLVYDSARKVVLGPSGEQLGKLGEIITVQGTDSNRRAKISFRVDTNEPLNFNRTQSFASSE